MKKTILLPGLRGENLLGFLAALGAVQVISREIQELKMFWVPQGSGWGAVLNVPVNVSDSSAEQIAQRVASKLSEMPQPHWILNWERFLTKNYSCQSSYFQESAAAWLKQKSEIEVSAVFGSQLDATAGTGEKVAKEHFDHPFRAARKDYYPGNLRSVIEKTTLSHISRTLTRPWDYMDAMDNQSLRLDHLDDRRHAYQWDAPSGDPARKKVGCMLGANRLAIEAFPLFPCIPTADGSNAIAFKCSSKTYTWITWPIWSKPCSIEVISSLLNLRLLTPEGHIREDLARMGIEAVFQSRRVPVEKNKVFLPPTLK